MTAGRLRDARRALRVLQAAARDTRAPESGDHGRSGRVPADLIEDDFRWLYLSRRETTLFEKAREALLNDLALEHVGRRADELVWRFVCEASRKRSVDHVEPLLTAHARDVESHSVFFTVLHLRAVEPFQFAGVEFFPLSDDRVPASAQLKDEPHAGAAVAVATAGTDRDRIVVRARKEATHALMLLRVASAQSINLHERQLRFQLGERFAFTDSRAGWALGPDAAWEASMSAVEADKLSEQRLAGLTPAPKGSIQRHANTAVRWLNRARFANDPVERLLFLFFSLEAILGDIGGGEKGRNLAFRLAMLDHVSSGSFNEPSKTFVLYDSVRSVAVHGGEPPEINMRTVDGFGSTIHRAINLFLAHADALGATKRSQVCVSLEQHEDSVELLAWLCERDPATWADYSPGSVNSSRIDDNPCS